VVDATMLEQGCVGDYLVSCVTAMAMVCFTRYGDEPYDGMSLAVMPSVSLFLLFLYQSQKISPINVY
jgi:hypothetical protein